MASPLPYHYEKVGEVGILETDTDEWYLDVGYPTVRVLQAKETFTLGTFDTPGQALDAAMKWAKGRGLKLDIPNMNIYKKVSTSK